MKDMGRPSAGSSQSGRGNGLRLLSDRLVSNAHELNMILLPKTNFCDDILNQEPKLVLSVQPPFHMSCTSVKKTVSIVS